MNVYILSWLLDTIMAYWASIDVSGNKEVENIFIFQTHVRKVATLHVAIVVLIVKHVAPRAKSTISEEDRNVSPLSFHHFSNPLIVYLAHSSMDLNSVVSMILIFWSISVFVISVPKKSTLLKYRLIYIINQLFIKITLDRRSPRGKWWSLLITCSYQ